VGATKDALPVLKPRRNHTVDTGLADMKPAISCTSPIVSFVSVEGGSVVKTILDLDLEEFVWTGRRYNLLGDLPSTFRLN
jgi:hypothetical protein